MIDFSERFQTKEPKFLFVASTGGHLEQLVRLASTNVVSPESMWVSFDSPQSESLLASKRKHFIPDIPTRDWLGSMRAISTFADILGREKFDGVISTGAAIAVPAFVAARRHRIPTLYIESVSRVVGPSLTGKIVSSSRLASHLQTQHSAWSDQRWKYSGSVLESYESVETDGSYKSAFVTLGTLKKYPFTGMVDSVVRSGATNESTVWQLGSTAPRQKLSGTVLDYISSSDFDENAKNADVVVSHAGVGSVLRLLALGIYPILLVRRSSRGEQVDDHQAQIASVMRELNLAVVREVDDLSYDDFSTAAARAISVRPPSRT